MRAYVQYENGKAFVIVDEAKLGVSGSGGGGNTVIIGPGTGGGGATVDKPITPVGTTVIIFDNNFTGYVQQNGNIVLNVATTGNVEGTEGVITIDGDSVSTLTLAPALRWIDAVGNTFDNTKRNRIFMTFNANEVVYSIIKSAIPAIGPPALLNASTNLAGTSIILGYARSIDPASAPVYTLSGGKTVSSVSIVGSIVTLTLSTPYIIGDVITISGGVVSDLFANLTAPLVNYPVLNTVSNFADTKSVFLTAGNQYPSTTANIIKMYFGTALGDNSYSYAFDIQYASNGSYQYYIAIDEMSIRLNDNQRLEMVVTDFNGTDNKITETTNVLPNLGTTLWNRVVVTWNGSTNTGTIYINGNLIPTTVTSSGTYTRSRASDSGSSLRLLSHFGVAFPATACKMNNLLIINKVLSPAEVTEDYNSNFVKDPATLSFVSNIVGDYRFENNLLDNSGNDYHMSSSVPISYSTDVK